MKKLLLLAVILFAGTFLIVSSAQTPLQYRDTSIKGPQTFAIILGISKYKYVRPLTYADKDAELFRDFLRSPGGGSIKDDNIFALLNDQALHSTFWTKGFQWLRAKQLQKGDRLFIYLAGHGDAIDEDQYFFLSYDCNPAGDKNNYLVGGAIQLYNLKKKIANETNKGVDVFFVMDACRSNELPGGQEGLNYLNNAITEKKAGEIMMLATAAGQESLEDASIGNGHGLFTWYLVDGLSGLAETGSPDSKITFSEIKKYVAANVPSVAARFNRKQDPFFCCNENDAKIISNIDAAYLQKWIQNKKRGGGNSFNGFTKEDYKRFAADTALVETYNRFNRAIRNNSLSGGSSAEDYYQQLATKYPNNPYTLDAKSTLAAEFINDAQERVNEYLNCGLVSSTKEKQQNAEAGDRLEKAINLLRQEDPDLASALRGRMYLLKATGNDGTGAEAFNFAHAARAIDPNGAYILNWLSR
ncbi:MAG TPA: caspase family protein, partial [Chitinophagaceae bacterium]|nr:caspase family protein [Chitinophagaceae bacterium]